MPTLEDIEQFKTTLKALGDEPAILSSWGESWHDLAPPARAASAPPPEADAASDSGEYGNLETVGDLAGDIPDATADSQDVDALLAGLSFDADDDTGGLQPGDEVPDQTSDDSGSLDLMDLLDLPDAGGQTSDASPDNAMDTAGFDLPESEDLSSTDESTAFDLSDFGVPDTDTDSSAPSADTSGTDDLDFSAEPTAGIVDSIEEGFDLPDIGDMGEPAGEPVDEVSGLSGLDDVPSFDESAGDADGPSTEPAGFDLPDLGDFGEPADEPVDEVSGLSGLSGFDDAPSFDAPAETTDDSFGLDDLAGDGPSDATASSDDRGTGGQEAGSGDIESQADPFGFDMGSGGGDAFDQFDLGSTDQAAGDFDLGSATFDTGSPAAGPGGFDLPDDQLGSFEEVTTADNFALDNDWGGDFSIPGFEMGNEAQSAQKAGTAKAKADATLADAFAAPKAPEEKKVKAVELTEEQADFLQDTLLAYPLNLRLAVEDVIANARGTDAQQTELIWMLVDGASPKDAAKLTGKILKRYIKVPDSFAKRTGAAWEAEKGSFRYVLVHSILPMLQVILMVAVAAGAMFWFGYTFAYRPLKANSLYTKGHEQIELKKYAESMEFFDRADSTWSMKTWHYRYARAYAANSQYPRAEAMYDRLLLSWPKETKAALEYATMEHEIYAFDKADTVLKTHILQRDYFNKDALSLSARNFLAWADYEEQRYEGPRQGFVEDLYENARLQLATLMERHGRSDPYLELMVLYLIRTEHASGQDNSADILPLANYVMESTKSAWSASVLTELASYLMDREEVEHVYTILLKAVDRDGTYPEAHVALARWNRRAGFPKEELKALEYANRFFMEADETTGLSTKRTKSYIAALIRLGQLRRGDGRSLDAEDAYNAAIERYEQGLAGLRFKRVKEFGAAYSNLADIYYSERMDFSGALQLYNEAERNGYITPDTDYRRGYIHYSLDPGGSDQALRYFYRAGLDTEASPYLQWATANALYLREDYFAALGYYHTLAERLQFELNQISLPQPQGRASHGEIVELLMLTRNNLGAALYRVAERLGDARRRSEAMVQFTESARLFDSMTRDQKTMLRSDSKNLGFLNVDFVLHPSRGIDMAVYRQLPAEMGYPRN